jgi:hypothetical protein
MLGDHNAAAGHGAIRLCAFSGMQRFWRLSADRGTSSVQSRESATATYVDMCQMRAEIN